MFKILKLELRPQIEVLKYKIFIIKSSHFQIKITSLWKLIRIAKLENFVLV